MTTVFANGKPLRLRDEDLLGVGGEGSVYRSGDRAVKIFATMTKLRKDKLAAFPLGMPQQIIGPLELCTDRKGDVVGYTMRVVDGSVDMHRVAQRKWQRASMTPPQLVSILRSLAATVQMVHSRGVVIGDLNDGNVAIERLPRGGFNPCLIDADSMQYAGFPCLVAHERFLDPRLYGVDLGKTPALSRESDFYALAVMAFASLVFVHPFGGAHASYPTMLRRAEARCSVLRSEVKLPAAALRPEVLPDDALAWFLRVFEKDAREPLPAALLDASFVACSCGATHARRACPMCTPAVALPPPARAIGRVRATILARGILAAVSVTDGRIAYVIEKDGALVREDGRVVSPVAVKGTLRIGAGGATTILGGGRAIRTNGDGTTTSVPVGTTVHGDPAADAGPRGLVWVNGDQIVREDGTRLGKVLEGQTHVRVGDKMGFAFYRAGAFTVAFVFDVERGPLRQIALPHLEGRLVEWSCAFDDAHVLFFAATERNGCTMHEAHLVDARGEIVASERGAPAPGTILAHASGKCAFGGAVLATTDEGLVLFRPDRAVRSFVAVRAFPETRDLTPQGTEIFVGPSGSLYALTHDALVHLSFEGEPS